jgi:hypothetical protein
LRLILDINENRPADVVPEPLIVQNEVTNFVGELVTLPAALQSPGTLTLRLLEPPHARL